MPDDPPDKGTTHVTRRRVLGGLITISAALAAAGTGRVVFLGEPDERSPSVVRSATIDLVPGNEDRTLTVIDTPPAMRDDHGLEPGTSGRGRVAVTNAGSTDGTLAITAGALASAENDRTGPERGLAAEDDAAPWASTGRDAGELHEALEVRLTLTSDADGVDDRRLTGGEFQPLRDAVRADTAYDPYPTPAGATTALTVEWRLSATASRAVRTDTVTVALGFELLR